MVTYVKSALPVLMAAIPHSEKGNRNVCLPWHWILWASLGFFGPSLPYHYGDKLIHSCEWDTEISPFLIIASTCPYSFCCCCYSHCFGVFFFQGQPKGTKLAYRIYESITRDWNMLICGLFHKQKNHKTWLLLVCVSPFLCMLSIKCLLKCCSLPLSGRN